MRLRRAAPGAPTVLLLHGLGVTADANWFPAYPPLAERSAWWPSTTGATAGGSAPERPVRLADCADDAVAALDVLGIDRAIAVGYSMGGPIAQLVWHRHRDRTAGLVLCATAHRFRGLEPVRDLGPSLVQRLRTTTTRPARRGRLDAGLRRWVAGELARTDRRRAVQAGLSLARFDASRVDRDESTCPTRSSSRRATPPSCPPASAAWSPPSPTRRCTRPSIDHTGCVTRPACSCLLSCGPWRTCSGPDRAA